MLKNFILSSIFALFSFSISSAETPPGYYAPASIAGGTLNAQDSNWPVYDETISFSSSGTFTANITNGTDDPSGSGSYTYSKTGTNTASLSYTIDGPGYSFEYDLQFTGENTGIYTKFADYGGGTTDDTTGPFSLSGVAVPEQYVWEDYDDFSGSSLDTNKWGTKYLGGGIEPYVSNGKLVLSGNSGNPSATKVVKSGWEDVFAGDDGGQAWVYPKDSDIVGIESEFFIPSSASSKSGLQVGVASLAPLSYANAELNAEPNSASQYSQGFGFYHLVNGSEVENFGTTQRDTTHKLGATLIDGKIKLYVDGEIRYEGETGTFNTDMFYINGFNDYQPQGLAFELTADNVRVLRRSQETTEPEPVTVISDPNGKAVVVQVGENYQWNNTLDAVTLWGVWEDDEDGWIGATIKYENGMQKASIGITDQLGNNLEVNHPYIIDENGMVKVTEDTAFQYYQVTAVENGVITTADDSSFPLSDTSKFFTTRAAAEEFYYSKVNPKDWMWFDHYPWVYSNEQQDWLYFHPSGGTLMYWSNKGQAWRQFN